MTTRKVVAKTTKVVAENKLCNLFRRYKLEGPTGFPAGPFLLYPATNFKHRRFLFDRMPVMSGKSMHPESVSC